MAAFSGNENFQVKPTKSKGYGCIAIKDIAPGTTIFQEGNVMRIAKPGHLYTADDLDAIFDGLSQIEKDQVLTLHDPADDDAASRAKYTQLQPSKLMRIMKANAWGDGDACWLHPTISRFNHACSPNAVTNMDPCCNGEDVQILAEKFIAAGEEICLCYNSDVYEGCTAHERKMLLRNQYGFRCACDICGQEKARGESDLRRREIAELKAQIYGKRLSEAGLKALENLDPESDAVLDIPQDQFFMDEFPPAKMSAAERVEKCLRLAALREAECLPATDVAKDYWKAADGRMEQIRQLDNTIILSWAADVRTWMEKAIATVDRVRTPYDHDPQILRHAWKMMQTKSGLKVALAYLDDKLKVPVKGSKGLKKGDAFALQVVAGTAELNVVSVEEYQAILEAAREKKTAPASRPLEEKAQANRWRSSKTAICGVAVIVIAPVAAAYWMLA